MGFTTAAPGFRHFIRSFAQDPDVLRTPADTEVLERIPVDERFTCVSPLEAIQTIAHYYSNDRALTWLPIAEPDAEPRYWTYNEYLKEVIRAANLFHELGLQPRESVLFMLPNLPELLFGIWAAESAGIALPVNPFLQPAQIASIAKEADAVILVTLADDQPEGSEYLRKAAEIVSRTPSIRHVITVAAAPSTDNKKSAVDWHLATHRQPADRFASARSITGCETAAYFHTGGTTGTPKLARHTHRGQVINVCQMALTAPAEQALTPRAIHAGDAGAGEENSRRTAPGKRPVILCGLPLFHVNAVFVSSLSALMGAGELILAGRNGFREKSLIQDLWQLIESHRVSFFAAVPTVYSSLMQVPGGNHDLSSLTHCSCGAAPVPRSLLQDFRARTGVNILEGYGMTETVTCATTHYFHGELRVGSIGYRLPYQQIRTAVLNSDGSVKRDCEVDEIGVLLVQGPNVIPAYKQPEANKGAWPESCWLNTGDMARIDAEGFVWLTGRAKDLIIRGGHNIDPQLTENALSTHPDIDKVAAVGMPDAYAGELPVACVTLRNGARVTAEQIVAYGRSHSQERAAAPVRVFILDQMPVTAVGKIFKPPLRKLVIEHAYREAVQYLCPDREIRVSVNDDSRSGLKVLLEANVHPQDMEKLETRIADALAPLTWPWELQVMQSWSAGAL